MAKEAAQGTEAQALSRRANELPYTQLQNAPLFSGSHLCPAWLANAVLITLLSILSPCLYYKTTPVELDEIAHWSVQRDNGLPKDWRGVYYFEGNRAPNRVDLSPLIAMDTAGCAFNNETRHLSCGPESIVTAPASDNRRKNGVYFSWLMMLLRFHFDYHFDASFERANVTMYACGVELTSAVGAVWHVEDASSWFAAKASTLRRMNFANATMAATRDRRNALVTHEPVKMISGDGELVDAMALERMKSVWGSHVNVLRPRFFA